MNINDLTKAVQALSQKSVLDYLQIILPIVLSFVAIWISIRTARKQNRIALFEKRIELLNEVELIICFAESVRDMKNPDKGRITNIFNSVYGMHLEGFDTLSMESMHARIKKAEMCFSMCDALFGKEYTKDLYTLTSALLLFMEPVLKYEDCTAEMKRFVDASLVFDSTKYNKMCKKVRI